MVVDQRFPLPTVTNDNNNRQLFNAFLSFFKSQNTGQNEPVVQQPKALAVSAANPLQVEARNFDHAEDFSYIDELPILYLSRSTLRRGCALS